MKSWVQFKKATELCRSNFPYLKMRSKLSKLEKIIKDMGSLIVAYSGGVDSTFLIKFAKDVVDTNVIAVTARSPIHPKAEYEEAKKIAESLGVRCITIRSKELNIPQFVANTPRRCYYCKKALFTQLKEIAEKRRIPWVADGTNFDDSSDFRPGIEALEELGIKSPLKEAGFTKEEIRKISKKMGLVTWSRPPSTCLATRIPYGEIITKKKLKMIELAEDYLHSIGISQVRARHHGKIVRIELKKEDMNLFSKPEFRKKVVSAFKKLGYTYITVDLEGYRTGSMNPVRSKTPKASAVSPQISNGVNEVLK